MDRRQFLTILGAGSLAGCIGVGDESTPTPKVVTKTVLKSRASESTAESSKPTTTAPARSPTATEATLTEQQEQTSTTADQQDQPPRQISSPDGWAYFRADLWNTGAKLTTTGPEKLQLLWKKKLNRSYTFPIVANGSLLLNTPHKLHSFDAQTGAKQWQLTVDNGVWRGGPSVIDGTVYIHKKIDNDTNKLIGINISNGEKIWEVDAPGSGISKIVGNTLYYGNRAVDMESGNVMWKFNNVDSKSPAIVDDTVYFYGHTGETSGNQTADTEGYYAVDANTGAKKWEYQKEEGIGLSWQPGPVFQNGYIYTFVELGRDPSLVALDASTGNVAWGTEYTETGLDVYEIFDGFASLQPAVTNKRIFFSTKTENTVYLNAVDAVSGEKEWRYSIGNSLGPPVVTKNAVYVGASDRVIALDRKTGAFKTSIKFEESGTIWIAVANNRVYALMQDTGNAYMLGEK